MRLSCNIPQIVRILIAAPLILAVSITVSAQSEPDDIVAAFLDAWDQQDYAAMYAWLHPRSQEIYPEPVFQARYEQTQLAIALTGLTYDIQSIALQGESAAVAYDITIDSASFGQIEDPARLMRLVNTEFGWRVAWSSLDIFDMLAGEAQLRAQSLPNDRSPIFDRNGQPLAADGQTTTAIFTAKDRMTDPQACINLLGEIGRKSTAQLSRTFANFNPETLFFLAELPTDIFVQFIDRLRSECGVQDDSVFTSPPHRVYYGGNATAHVTGWIGPIPQEQEAEYVARGYGSGDLVGVTGIEAAYQDTLAGRPERVLRIVEPGGTILREISASSGSASAPVTLTIDRDLQLTVTQAVVDAFNYAGPNWGSVSSGGAAVVLDVNTGGILALASYPLVDPSLFNPSSTIQDRGLALQQLVSDPRNPLTNRVVQEQLSPGSTFKLVTAAAILNEGLTTPDEIFDCQLFWEGEEYGDSLPQRQDWRVVDEMDPAGEITPAEAIMTSCNPFFWQYGALLFTEIGEEALPNYARRMGMAQVYDLNIGFPEAPGEVSVPLGADAAINESVGQGNVSLSPLHMATMVAALANGGTVYQPYMVQQVGAADPSAQTETNSPRILNALDFQPGVLETIQDGMCGVTTVKDLGTAYIRFGDPTGEFAPQAPYSVCGKTGTAQTAQFPNAWFVAYAPAENPEIAIAVVVEQSLEGSQGFGADCTSYP